LDEFSVLIFRSRDNDGNRRTFEDSVAAGLAEKGVPTLLLSHVYDLTSNHPVLRQLAESGRPIVAGAWLFPRASEWVLRWRLDGADLPDGRPERDISCVDFREHPSAAECVEKLTELAGAEASAPRAEAQDLADPAAPQWYPVVDYSRCKKCGQCIEFCLFGVYSLTPEENVFVASPDSCKTGCPACARVCPAGAIMFPHHEDDQAIAGGAVEAGDAGSALKQSGPARGDGLDSLIDELDKLES